VVHGANLAMWKAVAFSLQKLKGRSSLYDRYVHHRTEEPVGPKAITAFKNELFFKGLVWSSLDNLSRALIYRLKYTGMRWLRREISSRFKVYGSNHMVTRFQKKTKPKSMAFYPDVTGNKFYKNLADVPTPIVGDLYQGRRRYVPIPIVYSNRKKHIRVPVTGVPSKNNPWVIPGKVLPKEAPKPSKEVTLPSYVFDGAQVLRECGYCSSHEKPTTPKCWSNNLKEYCEFCHERGKPFDHQWVPGKKIDRTCDFHKLTTKVKPGLPGTSRQESGVCKCGRLKQGPLAICTFCTDKKAWRQVLEAKSGPIPEKARKCPYCDLGKPAIFGGSCLGCQGKGWYLP